MAKEFNALKITSGGASQMIRNQANKVNYGSNLIDRSVDPNKANIAIGSKMLQQQNIISSPSQDINTVEGEKMIARDILSGIGCSIIKGPKKNFSLLNDRQTSLLKNPNIDNNRSLFKVKNSLVLAKNNFPSQDDPIFQPDPNFTINQMKNITQQEEGQTQVVTLISDVTALNTAAAAQGATTQLKQFASYTSPQQGRFKGI
tara:strand:+ start:13193 stop:13798 length:606 start_codon:yes stop_codon:yes gene_type:complete